MKADVNESKLYWLSNSEMW